MTQTFHCPNCGAPLDPPAKSATTMRCPFCSSSVIVPEDLRKSSPGPDTLSRAQVMANLPDSSREMMEVIELTRTGNTQEAIRRFREAFGVSHKEAEQTIAAIEQNQVVQLSYPQAVVFDQTTPDENNAFQSAVGGLNLGTRIKNPPTRRKSTSGGILVIAFIAIVAALGGVMVVLVQPGAPLFRLWASMNPAGKIVLVSSFGEAGDLPGQMSDPENIAVDMNGNIFVADFTTGRIQHFDPEGNFVRLWDAGDGKVIIDALEVDQNGILYAAIERTVHRYDTKTGNELDPFPNPNNYYYEDFKILPGGGFGALVNSETLVRFNQDGSILWIVDEAIRSVADESDSGGKLVVDGNNNFYLVGRFVESVFKFSAEGKFLNRFGSEGDEPGLLDFVHAIAVDGQGRIYLNDWGKLEIFEADGQFLEQENLPSRAYDFQFGPDGKMYVISDVGTVYIYTVK